MRKNLDFESFQDNPLEFSAYIIILWQNNKV